MNSTLKKIFRLKKYPRRKCPARTRQQRRNRQKHTIRWRGFERWNRYEPSRLRRWNCTILPIRTWSWRFRKNWIEKRQSAWIKKVLWKVTYITHFYDLNDFLEVWTMKSLWTKPIKMLKLHDISHKNLKLTIT